MKKIMYTILKTALLLPLLAACSSENDSFLPGAGTEGNAIVLQFSTGDVPHSRATVPSEEGAEVAVKHLDVFIFEESGGKAHYERVTNCTDEQGTVTLAAKREAFEVNTGYWVYLIANSTHATAEFETIADLNSLKAMTQEDKNIFLTGITNIPDAPQSFLMDGIAYEATAAQEPAASAPVVLYNGVKSEDTKLKVTLRRAAAKIIVHIYKGGKVTFDNSLEVEEQKADPGYYLRNMPYTTSLLAGVGGEADLTTPGKMYNQYFAWTKDSITVTTYAYAHEWADASLEKEVRLVVNIPMKYTDESGKETEHVSSYYQIPISKDKVLKRNTCYQVTVTVNAPGALDPSEPEELTGIEYSVVPWKEINVDIDGDERPIFLYVNEEKMEMHNIDEDSTTLYFTSSSEVTATIDSVYYTDKFGQRKYLELHQDGDNNYAENIGSDRRPNWINECKIQITPDAGINGKIDVYSTIPENNTIRYIDITIKNKEGIERKVTIAQYPLEYITNILGWYSYRDDFEGTTYELLKGQDVKGNEYDSSNRITNWICGCTWEYYGWSYGKTETGFFGSKVAGTVATSGDNAGKAYIYYYKWNETRTNKGSYWNPKYVYTYSVSNGSYVWSNYANPRMYHVRITASSGTYTVGRPKITNGITDPGKDNAELVSPSFMIASQLGAVRSADNENIAASHCEQYVEVYKDAESGETIHLRDWRLPTKAELEIIMDFQYKDYAAMDEVLAGPSYWSASGLVYNDRGSGSEKAIRCVRDAYEPEQTP